MKSIFVTLFSMFMLINHSTSIKPTCPKHQVYLEQGPGPFCYETCCGPDGPPCYENSFTSGCFCEDNDKFIKKYPVQDGTFAELNNPCIPRKFCNFRICADKTKKCYGAHEEWRDCGPTNMCDNQVCRGARPICEDGEELVCVAGCFCQPGYSRDGDDCVRQCPLYP